MLRAFVLWLALGLAASAPAADLGMKSILLVASRELADPLFRESVVLVTDPGGHAPMGVIVNRPSEVPVSRAFPEVERLTASGEVLYFGGPVQRDELVVVFRAQRPPEGAIEVLEGIYLGARRPLASELLAREDAPANVRVFAGHAGWAPGQLEAEIRRGDWHLARAEAGAVFGPRPERLWRELEARARSKSASRGPPAGTARVAGGAVP